MNLYRWNGLRAWFEDVGVLYAGVIALVAAGFLAVWVIDRLNG